MTVTPEDAGRVRFRSALVFEDARPGVEMLARGALRDEAAAPVEICDWCARGDDGSRWVTVDQLVLENRLLEESPVPPLRHGICGDCSETMAAEVERVRAAGTPA